MLVYALRDEENHKNRSQMVDVPAEIRILYLPSTGQKRYRLASDVLYEDNPFYGKADG
jgi:hypothetical protein